MNRGFRIGNLLATSEKNMYKNMISKIDDER